jgi:hypothetical protein
VPNWKRIIVGEAFNLTSRDANYYRDLFLVWPFLLFSIIAVSGLWSAESRPERIYIYKMAALAVLVLLLAKEKAPLLLGSLGYVALKLGISLIFIHDWRVFAGFIVTAGTATLLIKVLNARNWKPSYDSLSGHRVLDIAVVVPGLLSGAYIVILCQPH